MAVATSCPRRSLPPSRSSIGPTARRRSDWRREGARLALAAGFEAEPLPAKEEHNTWRTLLGEAERHDARLVVVGAHGLSGARRLLLGSVSSAVVAHSRIPVLVVPTGAPSAAGDGPVLLCYDGSDSAKRAIGEAGDLVRRRRAVVLNVWESWADEAPGLARASRAVRTMALDLDEIAETQSERVSEEGRATAQTLDSRPGRFRGPRKPQSGEPFWTPQTRRAQR